MNLNQLVYFRVVREEQNISKAAAKLFISRPSLSTSIRELEKEFGTELLVRSKSGVIPTTAGEVLYRFSKAFGALYDSCIKDIEATKYRTRRTAIRLGITGGTIDPDTLDHIYCYEQEPEGLPVEVVNRDYPDFLKAIEQRTIDLAITACPPSLDYLEKILIGKIQQQLVVNRDNPLAQKGIVDFSNDLHGITLLETEGRLAPYQKLLDSFGIRRKMVGEDRGLIKLLIKHDQGCVMTIPSLLHRYVDEHSCVLPVCNIPLQMDLNPYLVLHSAAGEEIRRFADYVLECMLPTFSPDTRSNE